MQKTMHIHSVLRAAPERVSAFPGSDHDNALIRKNKASNTAPI